MKLDNQTPWPAVLFRTAIGDDHIGASVLARVTFDLIGGRPAPSASQAWKVSASPWECEYGPMDSDMLLCKGGVDIFLFGHARAPHGKPTTQSEVAIEVGSFRRNLLVFGDRLWQGNNDDLRPTSPLPFTEIALTPANAYGGKDSWDGLEVPFADNPDGKGFYLTAPAAVGKPLPNVEDPNHLIRKWEDRPEPAATTACPMTNGARLRRAVELDEEKGCIRRILPRLYNAAFPEMVAVEIRPGDAVSISGVTGNGPLGFPLPSSTPVVHLTLGKRILERPMAIDQLGVEADRGRFFIAYRYSFRYRLRPLEKRTCALSARTLR